MTIVFKTFHLCCSISLKRWEDDSRPLRVLTGPIDKITKWEKIKETCGVLFEVVGG
jgi:hypothetical protein